MRNAAIRMWLAGLASSLMVVAGAVDGASQDPADAHSLVRARGQGLVVFAEHCADCHGRSGRGDGPRVKELTVRPSDLTRLAERNGWAFPAAAVARVIEGTDRMHRAGEMPLWGDVFRSDPAVADDVAVKQRIQALTLYLEFIQTRRPRW